MGIFFAKSLMSQTDSCLNFANGVWIPAMERSGQGRNLQGRFWSDSRFARRRNKNTNMFIAQIVVCGLFCRLLAKEIFLGPLPSLKWKKALDTGALLYFLLIGLLFYSSRYSFLFFLLPPAFFLTLLVFLNRQEEKNLLSQLSSLLIPLESQMKLGLSFINSWRKSLEGIKSSKTKNRIRQIGDILEFQNQFYYPDREIENLVNDLIIIHKSPTPLKRLKHLQRKIKVEQTFRMKSKRVLLQIRLQSGILSLFYFSLLIWTIQAYGNKYGGLILLSFLFFCVGLIWIFKSGRKMKWSV